MEFNTKNFKDFLLEGKRQKKNILFYSRRRPAVWDLKSFAIIRKSRCNVLNETKLHGKNILTNLEKSVNEMRSRFSFILQNDEPLHSFFKIDNTSIWQVIRPKIRSLIESNLETTIFEILLAKELFKNYQINSVLVISEAGFTEQIVITLAKTYGIPIYHLQEGLHFDTPEAYENANLQGVYPELADQYFVWGEVSKDTAIKNAKTDPEKIKILGSPRFNDLVFDKSQNSEDFILLATMPPQIEEILGHNVKNLEKYLETITSICEMIINQKKKMIIKLHPTFDVLKIAKNLEKKYPEIKVISEGDINPLIRKCNVVIVTGLSTVIIQAQILQKPVVVIPIIDYGWGNPMVFQSDSCIISDVSKLDQLIRKVIDDRTFRNEIVKSANKFLENYLKFKGSSSKRVWEYVCMHNH